MNDSAVKTNLGIGENVEAALAYLVGFISGLFFLITEKENQFVRFHAAQSTIIFGFVLILMIFINVISRLLTSLIMAIGATYFLFQLFIGFFSLISTLIYLGAFVLWIYLMYMSYQGRKLEIPYASKYAKKLLK